MNVGNVARTVYGRCSNDVHADAGNVATGRRAVYVRRWIRHSAAHERPTGGGRAVGKRCMSGDWLPIRHTAVWKRLSSGRSGTGAEGTANTSTTASLPRSSAFLRRPSHAHMPLPAHILRSTTVSFRSTTVSPCGAQNGELFEQVQNFPPT